MIMHWVLIIGLEKSSMIAFRRSTALGITIRLARGDPRNARALLRVTISLAGSDPRNARALLNLMLILIVLASQGASISLENVNTRASEPFRRCVAI